MLNVHHNHDASDSTALHPAHYRDWRQRNEGIIDEIRSNLAAGLEIKRIFCSIKQFHLDAVIVKDDICNLVQQRAASAFVKQGLTTIQAMIRELGEGRDISIDILLTITSG
jgi:hypothetical protein